MERDRLQGVADRIVWFALVSWFCIFGHPGRRDAKWLRHGTLPRQWDICWVKCPMAYIQANYKWGAKQKLSQHSIRFLEVSNVSESLASLTHFASLQNTEEKGHRGRNKSFHLDGGADYIIHVLRQVQQIAIFFDFCAHFHVSSPVGTKTRLLRIFCLWVIEYQRVWLLLCTHTCIVLCF